jgi:AraC-like DNA-binding protein
MACFKAITAPRHMQRRIFDIALDYGFVSPSHFSHLFRRHFGISPSEAREMGEKRQGRPLELGMPTGGTATTDADRMWRWVKSLTASAAMRG